MIVKATADQITQIAQKQLETSAKFKQPRMVEILDNEDVNNFKLRPALQGRINIPFDSVFMSGFIDTLVAEVNRPPRLEFEDPNGANLKGARKIQSAWERDKKKMRLRMRDRAMKKQAAISGRGIAKYYAESDPKYCPYLEIVDYLDFHCEPGGGGHLDDHYFTGAENIFRTKEDLITGSQSSWYDKSQITELVNRYESADFKRNEDTFQNKVSRYASLGLDMEANNYIGGTLYNLCEWVTKYNGQLYHLIFEKQTGIWLRCVLLKEDFGYEKTPFISFASSQEDPFNFWNLGPADKAKPVFEAIRVNLNEVLNNNRKRNWDMKAVDKTMFPNLKDLDWRQDGVVVAQVPMGQSLANGIYSFETPEISGALNLNMYLNNIVGEKTGITPGAQGSAVEDKVGIYEGNQLQISKRMKLLSDSYEEMYEDLGHRYDWGLWDHASEKDMVKIISTDGVGWEKITKEDLDPEYDVNVVSSSEELVENEQETQRQIEVITSIEERPEQAALLNPKVIVEEKLRLAKFRPEKIKQIMNLESTTTDELLSEANKAIEKILEGKDPGLNQSATTGYLQYISDWMLDKADELDEKKAAEVQAYFDKHIPIATRNAERKQFNDELAAGTSGLPLAPQGAPVEEMPQGEISPLSPATPVIPNEPTR